ncbi:hypothetical protein ACLHDF_16160 [Priestia aryabhattai]|uniref:hypothetical protein n=1 Tax=Priestia megaterium TaxID=1404 RepID=UPI0039B89062
MQSMKSLTEALSVSPHLTMGSTFYLFSSIFSLLSSVGTLLLFLFSLFSLQIKISKEKVIREIWRINALNNK